MGTNTFPDFDHTNWQRQSTRIYWGRRWNDDELRYERNRTEEIVCFKECKTLSTRSMEFDRYYSQLELPQLRVYYYGQGTYESYDTYDLFEIDDIDIQDYGTGVSRIVLSASKTDDTWYYQNENGDWVPVAEEA